MVYEPRKQSMEMDYSKRTHFDKMASGEFVNTRNMGEKVPLKRSFQSSKRSDG